MLYRASDVSLRNTRRPSAASTPHHTPAVQQKIAARTQAIDGTCWGGGVKMCTRITCIFFCRPRCHTCRQAAHAMGGGVRWSQIIKTPGVAIRSTRPAPAASQSTPYSYVAKGGGRAYCVGNEQSSSVHFSAAATQTGGTRGVEVLPRGSVQGAGCGNRGKTLRQSIATHSATKLVALST
jgi:hypothetical protein